MCASGLGGNMDFIEKMFFVFDTNSNGKLNFKEMIVSIEMYRQTTYKHKLKVFFKLCNKNINGCYNEDMLYKLMKLNFHKAEMRR